MKLCAVALAVVLAVVFALLAAVYSGVGGLAVNALVTGCELQETLHVGQPAVRMRSMLAL